MVNPILVKASTESNDQPERLKIATPIGLSGEQPLRTLVPAQVNHSKQTFMPDDSMSPTINNKSLL